MISAGTLLVVVLVVLGAVCCAALAGAGWYVARFRVRRAREAQEQALLDEWIQTLRASRSAIAE